MTNAKTSSLTGLKQRRIIGKVAFYVLGLLVAIIVCIPFYWMIIQLKRPRRYYEHSRGVDSKRTDT